MEFQSATYVKPKGGPGRVADPNPYTDVVAEIALKKDDKGQPLARAFTLARGTDPTEFDKTVARVKRQLSEAGAVNDPKVTVPTHVGPALFKNGKEDPAKALVTFWTVPRQNRTRKPVTVPDDAPVVPDDATAAATGNGSFTV